jgi:hypothetical protein
LVQGKNSRNKGTSSLRTHLITIHKHNAELIREFLPDKKSDAEVERQALKQSTWLARLPAANHIHGILWP